MFRSTAILRAFAAVRQFTANLMRVLISAVTSAFRWAQDHIPRALGIRVIPDLLPERERSNESGLST